MTHSPPMPGEGARVVAGAAGDVEDGVEGGTGVAFVDGRDEGSLPADVSLQCYVVKNSTSIQLVVLCHVRMLEGKERWGRERSPHSSVEVS